jgi:hypothetical protein
MQAVTSQLTAAALRGCCNGRMRSVGCSRSVHSECCRGLAAVHPRQDHGVRGTCLWGSLMRLLLHMLVGVARVLARRLLPAPSGCQAAHAVVETRAARSSEAHRLISR